MITVIIHPKLPLDHLGDARRGPQVGLVAVRYRSLEEQLHQAAPLCGSKLRWAARRRGDSQCLSATSPPSVEPPHDRTGRTTDTTPDLIERQAGLQQRQGSPASVFQQISATLRSGHRCCVPSTPIIALFMQMSILPRRPTCGGPRKESAGSSGCGRTWSRPVSQRLQRHLSPPCLFSAQPAFPQRPSPIRPAFGC